MFFLRLDRRPYQNEDSKLRSTLNINHAWQLLTDSNPTIGKKTLKNPNPNFKFKPNNHCDFKKLIKGSCFIYSNEQNGIWISNEEGEKRATWFELRRRRRELFRHNLDKLFLPLLILFRLFSLFVSDGCVDGKVILIFFFFMIPSSFYCPLFWVFKFFFSWWVY